MVNASLPVEAVKRTPFPSTGSLRLNLGGRDTHIDGFLTVDVEPGSDIQGDISDLSQLADKSVDEIYASHCLEHFPHTRTLEVLKEWHRVLKPGAKLYVAVPDFHATIQVYLKSGMTDWVRNFLYGDQIYEKAFHYTCFTWPTLLNLLMEAGFQEANRVELFPYRLDDCSTLAVGNYRVSLNAEAVA